MFPKKLLLLVAFLSFFTKVNAQCVECVNPTGVTVSSVTNTTAVVSWTPGSACSVFEIWLTNTYTHTFTLVATVPSGTSYTLTGLDPFTPYTVTVAMKSTDPVSCQGESANFTTGGDGLGCPCAIVNDVNVISITNTSAKVTWGVGHPPCSSYFVWYTDPLTSLTYTYVVIGTNSLVLTGLIPGASYTVSVARIDNSTATPMCCAPTDVTFSTTHDGLPCYDCVQPTSLAITNITSTSADVSWTSGSTCNEFELYVTNNTTYSTTIIPVTGTSYTLTSLTPGTSYLIAVAQKTYILPPVSCIPIDQTFITEPCSDFTQSISHAYVNRVYIAEAYTITQTTIPYSPWPSPGLPSNVGPYMKNNTVYNIAKNTTMGLAWDDCMLPYSSNATGYISVWLDLNNNNTFESSEKVFYSTSSYGNSISSFSCYSRAIPVSPSGPGKTYTTPNATMYNVKGRFIISMGNDPNPCGPISDGQVLDFFVNIL